MKLSQRFGSKVGVVVPVDLSESLSQSIDCQVSHGRVGYSSAVLFESVITENYYPISAMAALVVLEATI